MGLLDVLNDPMNQQIMSAGLRDIGHAYGGGRGSPNMLALQKRQHEMAKARMAVLEKKRQEAMDRERREEIAQAYMVPGEQLTKHYAYDDNELFYTPQEYANDPTGIVTDVNDLINNETYTGEVTQPRAPQTPQEMVQGGRRALATGAYDPSDFNSLFASLMQGTAPKSQAAGSALVDPMTGEQIYSQPTVYEQDLAAGKPAEGAFTPKDKWGMTKDLYTQTTRDNDAFTTSRFQWNAIKNAPGDGAGDLILTIGLNKMLDPGSVVRGEEREAAASVAGTLSQYMNTIKNFTEGDELSPEAREKLRGAAQKLYEIRLKTYKRNYNATREMAIKWGLSTEEVFRGAFKPDAQQQEQPGGKPKIDPQAARAELERRRRIQQQQAINGAGNTYGS